MLPRKDHFLREDFLHRFAEVGNVEVLSTMLGQAMDKNPQADQAKSEQNTFLHTLAEKHDVRVLINLFQETNQKRTEMSKKEGQEEHRKIYKYDLDDNAENEKKETSANWLAKSIEMSNEKGYTFLAVAVDKIQEETESDMIRVLEWMIAIFGEDFVSRLCERIYNGGNSLMHLAVRKSLPKLMSFVLKKTKDPHKIFKKEGYNSLHLAVQTNRMVTYFPKHFDVNIHMNNGETALHIAAQLGDSSSLEALIERGGDLSVRDIEDGHTPLHDCLQQVYFEGGVTEEKCDKFIRIWNTVVEKAVQWWCQKQGEKCKPPAHGSEEYLKLQRKAVYYLRSLIKNNDGLSVLQFAADRGLITCVQTMLSTKAVFVLQTKASIKNQVTHSLEEETVHEIDVSNLCPEYFVKKTSLYSESELHMFKVTDDEKEENKNKHQNKGEKEMTSFLDVLAKIQPPNKAGEILESIPMRSLTRLEWRVTKRIHILWMVIHMFLMVFTSVEITTSNNDSPWSTVLGFIVLMYGTIITGSHFVLKIMRRANRGQKTLSVEESIKNTKKTMGKKWTN